MTQAPQELIQRPFSATHDFQEVSKEDHGLDYEIWPLLLFFLTETQLVSLD